MGNAIMLNPPGSGSDYGFDRIVTISESTSSSMLAPYLAEILGLQLGEVAICIGGGSLNVSRKLQMLCSYDYGGLKYTGCCLRDTNSSYLMTATSVSATLTAGDKYGIIKMLKYT